jgi:hypothetical protein
VTWSYSTIPSRDADTVVDIKIEPYIQNPDYFYISIRKTGSDQDEVWNTASDLERVINDLIKKVID